MRGYEGRGEGPACREGFFAVFDSSSATIARTCLINSPSSFSEMAGRMISDKSPARYSRSSSMLVYIMRAFSSSITARTST